MSKKIDVDITLTFDTLTVEYPEERNVYRTDDACDIIEKHFHDELEWEELHVNDTHTLHTFTPYQHLVFLVEEKHYDAIINICDMIEERGLFHKREILKP